MKLIAIGVSLLATHAWAGTTGDKLSEVVIAQEEPEYPIAGTFFTGNSDALIKLRDFAGRKGFVVEIITMPDCSQRLLITSALLFNNAFPEIFNEAKSGRLGEFKFSIVSGPAQVQ